MKLDLWLLSREDAGQWARMVLVGGRAQLKGTGFQQSLRKAPEDERCLMVSFQQHPGEGGLRQYQPFRGFAKCQNGARTLQAVLPGASGLGFVTANIYRQAMGTLAKRSTWLSFLGSCLLGSCAFDSVPSVRMVRARGRLRLPQHISPACYPASSLLGRRRCQLPEALSQFPEEDPLGGLDQFPRRRFLGGRQLFGSL